MKLNNNDILGMKPQLIADSRKDNPRWDSEYIQYDTAIGFKHGGNLKVALREFKERWPKNYKCFFPRIYHGTDNYDWRWANYVYAMHLKLAQIEPDYIKQYQSQRNAALFSVQWLATGLNQFFVTPELFDAAMNTKPPAEIKFDDFKMPHDALVFELPIGKLQYLGDDCTHIGIARFKKGDYMIDDGAIGEVKVKLDADKFIFTTAIREAEVHFGVGCYAMGLEQILKGGPEALAYSEGIFDGTNRKPIKEVTPDVYLIFDMIKLALNLILAMEVQPMLVERGRKIAMHKRERGREIWQPNFIGRKYRVVYDKAHSIAEGTHASPRMHWRAGHFRRQGFGHRAGNVCKCTHGRFEHYVEQLNTGIVLNNNFCMQGNCTCRNYERAERAFAEYRTIWIEPVLVNAKIGE